jgi:predicted HTH transcriptional regulator
MSRIRNQVIARAFREAGMIEQWGYGVQRMFRRAAALGLDEPHYVELPGRLRFIVPIRHGAILAGGLRSSQIDDPESVDSAPLSAPESLSGALSQGRAVDLLRVARSPVARVDLLGAIGLSNNTRNAARNIEPLVAAGLLAMSHPDRPRSSSQRYLTTDAGLEWLAEHE